MANTTIFAKDLTPGFYPSYDNGKTGGKNDQFELPTNLVVLVSVWGNTGLNEYNEFKHHKNIKAFVVNSTLAPEAMCPAYKKINGKVKLNKSMTCAKCGLCWGKKPGVNVIGCLEH